jgi:phosphohistidine phosphatase SixA
MFTRRLFTLSALLPLNASASEFAQALHSPNYVLLMRHAYAPGVGDPPNYALDRCEGQRLLNDEGKRQAVRNGDWLRQLGVQRATVLSSVWCRCMETAKLLGFGDVTAEASLASFFDEPRSATSQTTALRKLLATVLPSKGNKALILVTHHVNIAEFTGENIGSGDMVLAHIGPQGQLLDFRRYPSL